MFVGPTLAPCKDLPVLGRGGIVTQMLRHFGPGLERAQVHAREPRIGAEQFHVQGMVLPPPQDARLLRVPEIHVVRRPGEVDGLLDRGPQRGQPVAVAGNLPVAIDLEHAAELAVGTGAEVPARRAQGQLNAEGHAAVGTQIVRIVGVAHGAFQGREEEGQGLGVVPDVGATALAAAGRGMTALPAVEGAVFQAQRRGRLQD